MLKSEYKVLKYISKHEGITYKKLLRKYKHFDDVLFCISEYLRIDGQIERIDENGDYTGEKKLVDESKFYVTHTAREFIESRRHSSALFWFPYVITTIIAIGALLTQLLQLLSSPQWLNAVSRWLGK